MNESVFKKYFIYLLFVFLSISQTFAQESGGDEIDSAVKTLRNIDVNKLTDDDKKNKSDEINKAWETLRSSRDAGLKRIKKELELIEKTKESDNFFKLNVSVLLWDMGKTSETAAIAKIWNNTSFDVNYRYVFYTALDAARTQNEKVIPMLKSVLKDNISQVDSPQHSMSIPWPLTVEIIWGVYGHKGLPELLNVLKTSRNDVEIMSAMHILVNAQYIDALPKIRELINSKNHEIKNSAIKALGLFGHPMDSALLIKGLKSRDADLYSYVWAACEYDDSKLTSYLIPLLNDKDYNIKAEVVYALFNAITVEGLNALINDYKKAKDDKVIELYKKYIDPVLDFNKYDTMTIEEKNKIVLNLIERKKNYYLLGDEDKKITHDDFVEMSKHWIKENRISGEKYEWVNDRHVLSVTTAKDIDLLMDIKSSIYLRLSDECLYEIRTIDNVIKILGRRRYR
ncbi:MAG TPA: HEAT repeat domain-containing protein [Spirochaetota bacterium]|nr:HEAT repeat domain-containing protein [Spirochaetota bacterium]HOH36830.1 HEAT repeat domain-containing protein [Spirochaetota bacterium]HPY01909.1 HEAT repeat domain-containing protein [Spirochaetota bacterium]HQA51770.1 HEAT repeat domain-containing protein [Spirochaetota bacterium]